jgi:PIN domain nuclease of toxin-antitoxin system
MNLLLDTHALIWWVEDSPRLSLLAVEAIENAEGRVAFSAASIWEIATKLRIGKLRMRRGLGDAVSDLTRRARLEPLAISVEHGRLAGELEGPHKDPFDRMLIAQAQLEGFAVVTSDPIFRHYGVPMVW